MSISGSFGVFSHDKQSPVGANLFNTSVSICKTLHSLMDNFMSHSPVPLQVVAWKFFSTTQVPTVVFSMLYTEKYSFSHICSLSNPKQFFSRTSLLHLLIHVLSRTSSLPTLSNETRLQTDVDANCLHLYLSLLNHIRLTRNA